MKWLDGITNSMDMNLSKLREIVQEGNPAWCSPWDHKDWGTTYQFSQFSSVAQSWLTLRPRGLQHPGSLPLSRCCHPTIPSSVIPFSSCLKSFPASGSFPISQFFTSGGQSIGVSASASVLPMNSGLISFRMDWLDLLAVQGTLKSLLFQHHSSKASILKCSAFFIVQFSYPYMTTGKTIVLTIWTFVSKVISLLFNMLSRLVIAFLPRSKSLLILWPQLPSAVILEPRKIKFLTVSIVSHLLPWSNGTRCHYLNFMNAEFLFYLGGEFFSIYFY